MGMQLPAELADVAEAAGVRWPQADETAMAGSAAAWRRAGTELTTLAGDADADARGVFAAFEGPAADAARRHWNGYVREDGRLPTAVRQCTEAADRLDHAAEQVAAAKTEIIRQLVALKQSQDAAGTAQAAGLGDPMAALGTLLAGATAGVAQVTDQLTRAITLDSGVTVTQQPLLGLHGPAPHGMPGQAATGVVTGGGTPPGLVDNLLGVVSGGPPGQGAPVSGVVTGGPAGSGVLPPAVSGVVTGGRDVVPAVPVVSGVVEPAVPPASSGDGPPGRGLDHLLDLDPETTGPVPVNPGGGQVPPVTQVADPVVNPPRPDGPAQTQQALAGVLPVDLGGGAPATTPPVRADVPSFTSPGSGGGGGFTGGGGSGFAGGGFGGGSGGGGFAGGTGGSGGGSAGGTGGGSGGGSASGGGSGGSGAGAPGRAPIGLPGGNL
ncbi:MAG TPA: hypothetical protein VGD67_28075, partial [Pseudonocardiaceae bacterium]